MPVGNLGPEDVVTVAPDQTVDEVVDQFESEEVGAVVVTEGDEPVGLVTDRDVALAVGDGDDVAQQSVEELMTEDPVTIQEDAESIEAARTIQEENVRRLPVVDDGGSLSGIVSTDDVVATVGEQLDDIADTIEAQSPDYSP